MVQVTAVAEEEVGVQMLLVLACTTVLVGIRAGSTARLMVLPTVVTMVPVPCVTLARLTTSVQALVAAHVYRFEPAAAVVKKNISPVPHAAGSVAPVCIGFVGPTAERSADFVCVRKLTCVWASANPHKPPRRSKYRHRLFIRIIPPARPYVQLRARPSEAKQHRQENPANKSGLRTGNRICRARASR